MAGDARVGNNNNIKQATGNISVGGIICLDRRPTFVEVG